MEEERRTLNSGERAAAERRRDWMSEGSEKRRKVEGRLETRGMVGLEDAGGLGRGRLRFVEVEGTGGFRRKSKGERAWRRAESRDGVEVDS